MREELKQVFKTAPLKSIIIIVFIWFMMVVVNYYINTYMFYNGTRLTFPISVVYFSQFTLTEIFFAFSFLIFGLVILKYYKVLTKPQLVIIYIVLIALGNLAQGSIYFTFLRSILFSDYQYYHDAIKIESGLEFIRNFNRDQESLTMHAKTHPPFTVWIHYFFLKISNYSPLGLSLGLSMMGLTAVFPLLKILDLFEVEKIKRNLLLILFAVLPSVNIYSIVSIDAIFLSFSLFFLYGLLLTIKQSKFSWKAIFYMFTGFALANMISFSGTFLISIAFFISVYQLFIKKEKYTLINLIIVGISFLLLLGLFYQILNYNHIEAFFYASHSENPRGFRGFSEPETYYFTRLENICEILLFLSFGFLAYLFKPKVFNLSKSAVNFYLPMIAFFSLSLMFLSGAYGTGETARACLYIYPYFLLLLIHVKDLQILKNITYIALFQTFFMQMIGEYFW